MTWTTRPRSEIGGHPAVVAGTGPTVLLLHGVGLRAEAWGAQIDALAPLARCVAPDMPGHGASRVVLSEPGLAGYVAAARAVLDALGGPVVVAGHSMGAMLALALANHPKIKAIAALNAVFERSPQAATAVRARAGALDGRTVPDPTPTLQRWFGGTPSAARTACEGWLRAVSPTGYRHAYTAFAHSETPDRALLAALPCKAVFLTGALEPNSTPAMSHAMAALAPQGHAQIVEGAAHMLPMTHPQPVNALLSDLLAEARHAPA